MTIEAEPDGLAAFLGTVFYRGWLFTLEGPPWVVRAEPPAGPVFWFDIPGGWRHATPPVEQFWAVWLRRHLKTAAVRLVDAELWVETRRPFDPERVPVVVGVC